MTITKLEKLIRRLSLFALLTAALLFTSCATTQQSGGNATGAFKFTVMQYQEPVAVEGWLINPAQAVNPEGAALNVVVSMTHSDFPTWLSNWDATERPTLSAEEQQKLVAKWNTIKSGNIFIVDRVVAGTEEIIEFSVQSNGHEEIVQVPLKHSEGRWWLTSMEADSEYLNWKTSENKIIEKLDPKHLRDYLHQLQGITNVAQQ